MSKYPELAITLDRCLPGSRGTISEVSGAPQIRQRLLELGFVPGTIVQVVRYATLGDPIQVRVRGYNLSLRKAEARSVTIERSDDLEGHSVAEPSNFPDIPSGQSLL